MKDDYYFAGGKKVPLHRDERHIAIDLDDSKIGRLSKDIINALREKANIIKRSVALLAIDDIPEDALAFIREHGADLPVFHENGTLIIVLPEVRVEFDTEIELENIKSYLNTKAVTVQKQKRKRLSLVPNSRSGKEALELANQLGEKLKVGLSQARFLRVVPRGGNQTEE